MEKQNEAMNISIRSVLKQTKGAFTGFFVASGPF